MQIRFLCEKYEPWWINISSNNSDDAVGNQDYERLMFCAANQFFHWNGADTLIYITRLDNDINFYFSAFSFETHSDINMFNLFDVL